MFFLMETEKPSKPCNDLLNMAFDILVIEHLEQMPFDMRYSVDGLFVCNLISCMSPLSVNMRKTLCLKCLDCEVGCLLACGQPAS